MPPKKRASVLETEPQQLPSLTEFPIMDGIDILFEREGGLYECYIPMDLVDHMDVPVDADKLGGLIDEFKIIKATKGGTGQKTAVRMGYVPGEDTFRIVDGFHRYTALHQGESDTIFSTVEVMTLEDLLDDRIRNANVHDSIKFARTAEWMGEVWGINPLSKKITITSAFTLAFAPTMTGERLGLTAQEAEEAKNWAKAKAKIWGSSVATIYSTLHTKDNVDAKIIHEVRSGTKGTKAKSSSEAEKEVSPLVQSVAKRMGEVLPKKFEMQKLIADAMKAHKLSIAEVSKLMTEVKDMQPEEAEGYIAAINWKARRVAKEKTFQYKESDLVRTTNVRESSAIQPMTEIVLATLIAFDGANLSDLSPQRREALMEDLQGSVEKIIGMIATMEALGTKSATVETDNDLAANSRPKSTHDFLMDLGASLDDGNFPAIQNQAHLDAAYNMINDDDIMSSVKKPIREKLKKLVQAAEQRLN